MRDERRSRSAAGGEIDETRVAAVARGQRGLITARQLVDAGLDRHAVLRRVRHGWLVRVHRGVYRVGPVAAPFSAELAAVLACGPGACLSHESAAGVWGFHRATGDVHISTERQIRSRPGIRVHHTHSVRAAVRHDLPLTTAARTLIDLAATLPQHELDRAVEQALVQRLATTADLTGTGGRGAARLRAALRTDPTLTRSEAERRLLALIRAAALPVPETNVRVAGWEVDLLWREQRLVVEVDGYAYHGSRHAFERDRRKDADLVATGYRVVRFTWRQITEEPLAVAARLATLLQPSARPYWRS